MWRAARFVRLCVAAILTAGFSVLTVSALAPAATAAAATSSPDEVLITCDGVGACQTTSVPAEAAVVQSVLAQAISELCAHLTVGNATTGCTYGGSSGPAGDIYYLNLEEDGVSYLFTLLEENECEVQATVEIVSAGRITVWTGYIALEDASCEGF